MHTLALLGWLALCALQDACQRRIANWLTFGGVLAALVYLALAGKSWLGAAPAAALGAGMLALLLGLPGYALGRLGGADVKLLVLLGLASDSRHLLYSLIGAGACYVAWSLLARPLWPRLNARLRHRLRHLAPERARVYPFAPFLWLGLLLAIGLPPNGP